MPAEPPAPDAPAAPSGAAPAGAPGPAAAPDGNLTARWAALWRRSPEAPVLHAGTTGARGERVTGRELDERSAAAAVALARCGLGPKDRMVWSMAPSVPAVVAAVAALRLGAVVVPVDPRARARELAAVVHDVRPVAAVVDRREVAHLVDRAARGAVRVCDPSLAPVPATGDRAVAVGDDAATATRGATLLDTAAAGDPALIVYTSGTTGRPKGAVLSHHALACGTASLREAWEWTPDDRLVLSLPLFHVHGLCAGLMGTLGAGASAVLVSPFSPGAVAEAAGSATMFFGVPTMYHRLAADESVRCLGRLRLCVSGSAPLAPALWHRLHGAAGVEVLERYGMTETLLTLSNPLHGERRPGTVGRPLPGVEARVDGDPEAGGDLLVRTPGLFSGYWERPGATEAVWRDGWFVTGDVASVDPDGYHRIRGRRSDVIISGGHNVHPAEVEDVLRRHPAVHDVAVAGTPSEEWGEAVTAYVVPEGTPFPTEAVLAFCAEHLAPSKRPRALHVVDALPRNAMGKVERRLLGGAGPDTAGGSVASPG